MAKGDAMQFNRSIRDRELGNIFMMHKWMEKSFVLLNEITPTLCWSSPITPISRPSVIIIFISSSSKSIIVNIRRTAKGVTIVIQMQFSQRISSHWNVYSTSPAIPSILRQSWVIMMATDTYSKQLMKYKCFQKLTIFGWSCRSSQNMKWFRKRETDSPSIELLFGQTLNYSRGDIPHHLATAKFGLIGCSYIQKSQGNEAHPDGGNSAKPHNRINLLKNIQQWENAFNLMENYQSFIQHMYI